MLISPFWLACGAVAGAGGLIVGLWKRVFGKDKGK
jgi:hypothetical protein